MADPVVMLRSVLDPEMPLSERAAIEAAIAEIERLRAEDARLSLDLMTALGELMEARRA